MSQGGAANYAVPQGTTVPITCSREHLWSQNFLSEAVLLSHAVLGGGDGGTHAKYTCVSMHPTKGLQTTIATSCSP